MALQPCQAPYQNRAMEGQAIWGVSLSSANEKLWFLAQNCCWSLTPNSFHVCPFTCSGMGRMWSWSLLSKSIVAGFLFWFHSNGPLLLCCVWGAYWCLGLPLSLANLIYITCICCTPYSFTVHLTGFFLQTAWIFSHFPDTCMWPLVLVTAFWSLCISRIKTKSSSFAVRALKHRQFILGSLDFQFLSLHFSGLWWVLHFATTTSFLALPVADFTRSKRHSCKCLTHSA